MAQSAKKEAMPDSVTNVNNNFLISTIIPTVGRPSLERAVRSVLSQEISRDETEVIVVEVSFSMFLMTMTGYCLVLLHSSKKPIRLTRTHDGCMVWQRG